MSHETVLTTFSVYVGSPCDASPESSLHQVMYSLVLAHSMHRMISPRHMCVFVDSADTVSYLIQAFFSDAVAFYGCRVLVTAIGAIYRLCHLGATLDA